MMRQKLLLGSVLGLSVFMASQTIAKPKADKKDWRANDNCHRTSPVEAPTVLRKDQIKFVGIDIGKEGELKRLLLKPDILSRLPDNFIFDKNTDSLIRILIVYQI